MIKQRLFFVPMILFMLAIPTLGIAQPAVETASCYEKDAQSLLSAFMSYTDMRIRSIQQSLELLASTSQARSGKWKGMKSLLKTYQDTDDGLVVWYLRPDGTYYTVDQGQMDKKLNDRRYFPDLMAGGKITGSLVISKSTGRRSAVIAVPVVKNGKVVGAIGASVFLDKLAGQINTVLNLRQDIAFFALAPDGQTAVHKETDRHFLDPRELGSESLKKAATEILSGTEGKTTYDFDNVTKQAIYRTSPLTQWRFAIAFDISPRN